jgi:glucose/arabinose dehydrogenase
VGHAAVVIAIAVGCGGSDEPSTPEPPPPSPPPAGDGGREVPAPPVGAGTGGVRLKQIGEFEQPLYLTQPSGGDPDHLYVVERCGRIVRVPTDGSEGETFLDVSGLITCEATEQGLLSVAFAPEYERSGLLYVDYTDTAGDTRVVEYRATPDGARADPASAREILRVDQPYTNHNGGLVLFGPDRRLYVGLGDGGSGGDPERRGQDLGTILGKLVRIDPRRRGGDPYLIPADNPLADEPGAADPAPTPDEQATGDILGEITAYGLRNPWRFAFDRETGMLWIGDVGQSDREEIDAVALGALTAAEPPNFGWSAYEGTLRYNEDESAPGALEPVLEYGRDDGCSVTGGVVVRDPTLRSLYGRYLYGDYCEGELRSFTATEATTPQAPEARDDTALGLRVEALSSFGEDAAGRVYATSLGGPVYRLTGAGGD